MYGRVELEIQQVEFNPVIKAFVMYEHLIMISPFVFATYIVQFLYFLNPKFQAWFVSDLVGNPVDCFSRDAANKRVTFV